jgi:hypothetical protein
MTVEVREDAIVLRPRPARAWDRLWGLGKGIWEGVDPVEFVRKGRDEWDRELDERLGHVERDADR